MCAVCLKQRSAPWLLQFVVKNWKCEKMNVNFISFEPNNQENINYIYGLYIIGFIGILKQSNFENNLKFIHA